MRIIYYLFLVLLIFGCKHRKEDNFDQKVDQQDLDGFILKIDAIIEYDDEFRLFFLEKKQKSITNENSVSINVVGSLNNQELIFEIKKGVLPEKLFLRFGNEVRKQKITILASKVSYGEDSFEISSDKFYQFFIPNEFLEYDVENAIVIAKEVNGKYDPWFGSREVLIDKMFFDFF